MARCPPRPERRATRRNFALLLRVCALVIAVGWTGAACATVAVLQPAREAAAQQPLELTLLYTDDDARPLTVEVPKQLNVTLTNGDLPPQPLALQRDPAVPDRLTLRPGQYRRVRFSAPWPDSARGTVKIDPVGFDSLRMVWMSRTDRGPRSHKARRLRARPWSAGRAWPCAGVLTNTFVIVNEKFRHTDLDVLTALSPPWAAPRCRSPAPQGRYAPWRGLWRRAQSGFDLPDRI